MLDAEPFARRTPAERAVERVVVRVERLEAQVAPVARQVLRILLDLPFGLVLVGIDVADVHHAAAEVQGLLHRLRHAGPCAWLHHIAIDHDLDLVFAAMVDQRRLVHAIALTVHAHADKTGPANLFPQSLVLLLPLAFQRRHDVELRALGE